MCAVFQNLILQQMSDLLHSKSLKSYCSRPISGTHFVPDVTAIGSVTYPGIQMGPGEIIKFPGEIIKSLSGAPPLSPQHLF